MNMALKSGTQKFHGAAYEFMRNSALDSRAFATISKQKLTYNNFGWNLGGPLYIPGKLEKLKDKLFFFTGMDMKRLRKGYPTVWQVPDVYTRNGDFSRLPVAQQPIDVTNGLPFPNGIIPDSRMSPNSKRLVGNYPLPNFQGSGGNYSFNYNYPMNVDEYIVKIDYNLSPKHQFSFMRVHDEYYSMENLNTLVSYSRPIPATNQSWKWTYVVNPTTVNTFQFSLPGHHIYQNGQQ
jgi:hypothetical protein